MKISEPGIDGDRPIKVGHRRWKTWAGTFVTLGPDGQWWPWNLHDEQTGIHSLKAWFDALHLHQGIDELIGMEAPNEHISG